MRTPVVYSADQIKSWNVQRCVSNGLWTQARPESFSGLNLIKRFTAAWMVFTGQADVLTWLGDKE